MQKTDYSTIKLLFKENKQLFFAAKCLQNVEITLKEYSISKKIRLLDQPISTCPMQLIIQKGLT